MTSEEPDYIRQCADPMDLTEVNEWAASAYQEARAKGCAWFRWTYHETIPNLRLLEAWRVQPKNQGEVRWALTDAPSTRQPPLDATTSS